MANQSKKIVVGANGAVAVAPTSAPAPTDATGALNVAFKQFGFVAESGVTVTPSQTITPIMAWQSAYAVRKIVTARGLELDFTLREFNLETIPFAFGGGSLVPSGGEFLYTPPDPEEIDIRSLVVDWSDGDRNYRLYVPNGQVTDIGAFTVSRTAPAELPVKFEINSDGISPAWLMFSDDTGLGS